MKKIGRIWVTTPDETDGYFVELISVRAKLDFQDDAAWFKTVEECRDWALQLGATTIEKI